MEFASILVAVLSSGALFGFIQFMISRHDIRFNKLDEIQESLKKLNERIDDVERNEEEREAKQWRTKILRFADEVYMGQEHSQEHYQDMLDIITSYDMYCENHPGFMNGKTIDAANRIKDNYHDLLEKHKF